MGVRIDRRQLAAYAVILAFMFVTVGHVASFTGSFEQPGFAWLGWPYALAVDCSIAVCAWLTRWKTTRVMAWLGYFTFVVASGTLNVAAVAPWAQAQMLGAWVYALFPTLAIALLGFLARDTELLAQRSARSKDRGVQQAQPETQVVVSQMHECGYCDRQFATSQGVSAHLRFCDAYAEHKRNGREVEVVATTPISTTGIVAG